MAKKTIQLVQRFLTTLQNDICTALEAEEPSAKFEQHPWKDPQKGEGETRVIANGSTLEKGGVNYSYVQGDALPKAASVKYPECAGHPFHAMGVSVVIHPNNPFVPTAHFNVRYFMSECEPHIWWFGGGFDLTPYYGFEEDCIHWHTMAKAACDPFGPTIYTDYKKACDDYFYLPHRKEARGIGGLFFDDLNEWGFDQSFAFIQSVGEYFIKAYTPIISKRKDHPFTEQHKTFQRYRRARYVEFNLVYDRGTHFGLQFGGRTESILVSMPPIASWGYEWHPLKGTEEEKLYTNFLPAREWI